PGAGAGPTAAACLADVVDIARGALRPLFARPASTLTAATPLPHGDEHAPYYLRFMLQDAPGALAQVAAELGREGISIHRMRQYDRGEPVPVVVVTHDARRDAVDRALATIEHLPVCAEAPVAMRIEE
ncbi:MAG: ACT domain-containing protein, partial [Pseudomonadota bacterium]